MLGDYYPILTSVFPGAISVANVSREPGWHSRNRVGLLFTTQVAGDLRYTVSGICLFFKVLSTAKRAIPRGSLKGRVWWARAVITATREYKKHFQY